MVELLKEKKTFYLCEIYMLDYRNDKKVSTNGNFDNKF